MKSIRCWGCVLVVAAFALPAFGQGHTLTNADYARAAKFLLQSTDPLVGSHYDPLVYHDVKNVRWLDATHFWYRDHGPDGDHFIEVDAATGKIAPAFDQAKLAAALGKTRGKPLNATSWPKFFGFHRDKDGKLSVTLGRQQFTCDLRGAGVCTQRTRAGKGGGRMMMMRFGGGGSTSPNGTWQAFTRKSNLWLRHTKTHKEIQLTKDGVEDDSYGGGFGGGVKWSPDSTYLVAFRKDTRGVTKMYTIRTQVGHPKLETWTYALPGDKHVPMAQPVVVNVATRSVTPLAMAPEQQLGSWMDVQWSPDGRHFAFISTSRNRQHKWFRIGDAATGTVRTVFEYNAKDYYQGSYGRPDWYYLPKHHQAIWPTEQNDWMNLYLYSTRTGKVLHPITTGTGDVTNVVHFDRKTRTLWYVGVGRTPGVNPYYRQLFKVNIDTGKTTLLTPGDADHAITMSPNGKFFIDATSTPTQPQATTLRSARDGHLITTVAKTDISALKAEGWVPPVPFTVKARDGKTTLYGLLFKPTNFDPGKHYPVIDFVYPGPQIGSIQTFGFRSERGGHQALAELGFIVVTVNGMGTPYRSASFQREWYGNMGDDTLPDQITTIKQLAARHPWMDLERVGIWGHSGGGNATFSAMVHYPDFFKVGWAESGNYDNRDYDYTWGEKWQGLLVKHKDGTTNYDNQASERLAKNLKGKLMLVTGAVDNNVAPSNTYLVVDALIKANKDFSMLVIPNERHHFGAKTPWVTRQMWDWFVTNLAGNTPPHEFDGMPKTLTQ